MFEEAIHERRRYYQVGHQNMSRMHIRLCTGGVGSEVEMQVADYLTVLEEMHRLDSDLRAAEMYVCTAPLVQLALITARLCVSGSDFEGIEACAACACFVPSAGVACYVQLWRNRCWHTWGCSCTLTWTGRQIGSSTHLPGRSMATLPRASAGCRSLC